MYKKAIAVTVAFITLATSPAFAIEQLPNIVVSAMRSTQTTAPSPGNITVINQSEIRNSGASTVSEILQNQGGIVISDLYGDGSFTAVSMRGFSETAHSNVLIMVDGRRLNNSDIAAPSLNTINVSNIDHIEIIEGSAGILYGDQAVAGVINIVTQQPKSFQGQISLQGGSFSRKGATAHFSDRYDNGVFYTLTGNAFNTDNYRENNGLFRRELFIKVGSNYSQGQIFYEHQKNNEYLNLPGGLFIDEFTQDRRQTTHPDDFSNIRTQMMRLGISHDIIPGLTFEGEITQRTNDVNAKLVGSIVRNLKQSREIQEFTPRLIIERETAQGPWLTTLGSDLVLTDYKLNSPFGDQLDRQIKQAFYLQTSYSFLPKWTATLGHRYAKIKDSLQDIGAFATFPTGTHFRDRINASQAALAYQFNDHGRFFLRWDENFRFAKVDEQLLPPFGSTRLLNTQTGRSWELGGRYHFKQGMVQATLYALKLANEISFDPITFINLNLESTRRYGSTLSIKKQWFGRLDTELSYQSVNATFTQEGFAGKQIPGTISHSGLFKTAYRWNRALSSLLEIQYVGDRIADSDFDNALQPLSAFVVSNLNVGYHPNRRWNASVRINNLFDREYSSFAAATFRNSTFRNETGFYAAPERNFWVTLGYHFSERNGVE